MNSRGTPGAPAHAPPLNTAGLACCLAAAVCISLSNVFSPVVYGDGTSVTGLLLARFLAFPVLCLAWIAFQGFSLELTNRERAICLGAGIFYCAGHGSLIASFTFMPVGIAVLILFTFPFITLAIECALDRLLPSPARLMCVIAAFCGLALAIGVEGGEWDYRGVVLAIAAPLLVAAAFVTTARMLVGVEPTVMTFHMSLAGIVFAVAAAFVAGDFALHLTPLTALLALIAAVLSFNGAFLGMFAGVRLIGAAPTAMFMNMEPVFTLALAFFILGETLGLQQILGAALVIGAVIAAQTVANR